MSLILDCTLRDGGYYTNWDFPNSCLDTYFERVNELPIDFLEVGYRNLPSLDYKGEFFYTSLPSLDFIKAKTDKKLAILLDSKDVPVNQLANLLNPIQAKVDMVRLAVNPKDLGIIVEKTALIKNLGFITCLNIMYMSTWDSIPGFYDSLAIISRHADYIYLVDSYGSVVPDQIKEIVGKVKAFSDKKIGFHGHNNLELALINTIAAMDSGAAIVDSTITGMGRGAGNLKTELLLTFLNKSLGLPVNFDALGSVVQSFENLRVIHQWGTNLPYMISGANSLPQKEVMDWVSKRYYSFNSIIRALENQKSGIKDNASFPDFTAPQSFATAFIIGGGPAVSMHHRAIESYISKFDNAAIIHASSKNAGYFKSTRLPQFHCLVGNEGIRLSKVFADLADFSGLCILPPFPRKMGTFVPELIQSQTFQLKEITFTHRLHDSHTVLALAIALELDATEIILLGYDGYLESASSILEKALTEENEFSFTKFQDYTKLKLTSLTPTAYQSLDKNSIYALL